MSRSNGWRHAGAARGVFVLVGVLVLVGCVREVPLVSEARVTTNMTLDELREWVGEHLDAAVEVSGAADGWYKSRRTIPWTESQVDRDGVLNMSMPLDCGGSGARIDVALKNDDLEDPLGAAARVRAFWESEGWVVSDIWSEPSAESPHFRADGEDGALLAFQANASGVSLSVASSCSVNNTVTNWRAHLDDVNEFDDELARREAEGE